MLMKFGDHFSGNEMDASKFEAFGGMYFADPDWFIRVERLSVVGVGEVVN